MNTLKSFIFSNYAGNFLPLAFFFGGILLLSNQALALTGNIYHLNPGDRLEITVWQEESLKQEVVVFADGTISFPLVGHV